MKSDYADNGLQIWWIDSMINSNLLFTLFSGFPYPKQVVDLATTNGCKHFWTICCRQLPLLLHQGRFSNYAGEDIFSQGSSLPPIVSYRCLPSQNRAGSPWAHGWPSTRAGDTRCWSSRSELWTSPEFGVLQSSDFRKLWTSPPVGRLAVSPSHTLPKCSAACNILRWKRD